MKRVAVALCLATTMLVGCGVPAASLSVSPDFTLTIVNIDGPTVAIIVNEQRVGTAPCQLESSAPAPVLTPGSPMPPLPWLVRLERLSGGSLGNWTESGSDGPRVLVVRGTEVSEQPAPAAVGPAPAGPCPH